MEERKNGLSENLMLKEKYRICIGWILNGNDLTKYTGNGQGNSRASKHFYVDY
jgi:hypothetical protein